MILTCRCYDPVTGKFIHGLRTDRRYDTWGNAT